MRLDLRLSAEDRPRKHEILAERTEDVVELVVDGHEMDARVEPGDDGALLVDLGDTQHEVRVDDTGRARIDGHDVSFQLTSFEPGRGLGDEELLVEAEGRVQPPMPGKILAVNVEEGDEVEAGDVLATLEAMKMQSDIEAPRAGTVLVVDAAEGEAVEGDQVLFAIGDPEET